MTLKHRLIVGSAVGALSIATAVVSYYEGYRPDAYRDPVGIPTICYGHTATATIGQALTREECKTLLAGDLGMALAAIDKHATPKLTPQTRAALASFAYNVGETRFARSTLLRKLNTGDLRGACRELSRWVYAGGRKLAGLVKRRATEQALCLAGLDSPSAARAKEGKP